MYGLVVSVLIAGSSKPTLLIFKIHPWSLQLSATVSPTEPYSLFAGFVHLGAGLACGFTGLAAGYAIGIVGDAVCLSLALCG